MALKPNQVVSVYFTVKDELDEIVDETTIGNPFTFLSGKNQILPALEEEIGNMIIGSKKNIVLKPSDAYGEYIPEAIQVVTRSEFPEEMEIEEGLNFVANTPEGNQLPFIITEVDGDNITIDFNHPLAGETLTFDVELIDIRQATNEEMLHGHVHDGHNGH
jgi:FKBP-type peptidyl-prolyl cis-trans isomerase SlyD